MRALPRTALLLVAALAVCAAGCGDADSRDPERAAAATPAEAIVAVMNEPDPFARYGALADLLSELGPEAVPAVRSRLNLNRVTQRGGEYELFVHFWAVHDPAGAADWALAQRRSRHKLIAVGTAVEMLARTDPEAALETLEAIQAEGIDSGAAAQVSLVRGWFQRDRDAVARYVTGLESGEALDRSLLSFAMELGRSEGSDAVVAWAESLESEDGALELSAYRQVSSALAWSDPEAARGWCAEHCEGPYGDGMRPAIAKILLRRGEDGGSILEWAASGPEDPENDVALVSVYRAWIEWNRGAALEWVASQAADEPDPRVRKLYGTYARELSTTAPAEAVRFVAEMELEGEHEAAAREALLVELARHWLRVDTRAATLWLERSSLAPELIERIQGPSGAAKRSEEPAEGTAEL